MDETKVKPNTEPVIENGEDTIPNLNGTDENSTVSIKFNKEKKDIPISEAAILAQKGLKYELIENDFARLKEMALKSGKSVDEFLSEIEQKNKLSRRKELIEQAGGNEKIADYIIKLENGTEKCSNGFGEVKEMFPEINEIGELPAEVLEASEQKGKNLLDCYLRYLYGKNIKEKTNEKKIQSANSSGVGSLKTGSLSEESAANHEFLKGLWGR